MALRADNYAGFAIDLLGALGLTAERNVVVSPWSVSSALGVLGPGCDLPARREIAAALRAGDDDQGPAVDAARVARPASRRDGGLLAVANTLWIDEQQTPERGFVDQLDRWPGAGLRSAPIATDPDGARRAMNAYVAECTRDLIPELLPLGSITAEERAVVVNALYLLVAWLGRCTPSASAASSTATLRPW